jgi:hypothetical protein
MESACFELYPPKWTPNDAFDLFVPLKNRQPVDIDETG